MELSQHETLWLQSEGAKMLKDLGVKNGDTIIDFGCGKGRYTIPLSQVVGTQGCVYSVERNEDALTILRERLPLFSMMDTIKILHLDNLTTQTTIAEKTIDAVFVFDVLQYIEDWDALFSYFFRVIKPTGIIHVYPAAIPHPGEVDVQRLISTMEKVGFQYLKSTTWRMMHNVDMVNDVVYSFGVR